MKHIKSEIFNRLGNSHKIWRTKAQELFSAAKVLSREREKAEAEPHIAGVSKGKIEYLTHWVELMLCGFGIECLLKALWLKKSNPIAKDGTYIHVMKKENHDLVALCQAIAFPLDSKEKSVLAKLSELVRATGRYPIAKKHIHMHEETTLWSSTEDEVVGMFVQRLKREIVNTKFSS